MLVNGRCKKQIIISVVTVLVIVLAVIVTLVIKIINEEPHYPYLYEKDGLILRYNIEQTRKGIEVDAVLTNESSEPVSASLPNSGARLISISMIKEGDAYYLYTKTLYPQGHFGNVQTATTVIIVRTLEPGNSVREKVLISPLTHSSRQNYNNKRNLKDKKKSRYILYIDTPFISKDIEGEYIDGQFVFKDK
ncbi:hypothetical protein P4679_23100 [Priestia megaterium]|uniref:hypothetical protein n=1 Tax=Priestia megaterium TaxID=1404 RepID=UPI002E1A954D|nr:hypothetical protein [Priestia megaterium]